MKASINREISQFEVGISKEMGKYKIMVKMGPVLGLMGTLIPLGPALAGLSSGDISAMAYNMYVAFVLFQICQRWL